ncbi:hypothetical protein WJX73_002831 [Symbiochloris irregularis]|uniref:Uncharacterized protein n=1 Tax=Symbiochloris irregularis TaxID=706552 RepID=A0AAW1P6S1_9CHLO
MPHVEFGPAQCCLGDCNRNLLPALEWRFTDLAEGFCTGRLAASHRDRLETHCIAFLQPDAQKFQDAVDAILMRYICRHQQEAMPQMSLWQQYWVSVDRPQEVRAFALQDWQARSQQASFKRATPFSMLHR